VNENAAIIGRGEQKRKRLRSTVADNNAKNNGFSHFVHHIDVAHVQK